MSKRMKESKKEDPGNYFFETQQVFVLWLRDSSRENYTKRHSIDGSSPVDWALAKEAKKIKSNYDDFLSKTFPITSDDSWSSSECEEEEATWWAEGKKRNKLVQF